MVKQIPRYEPYPALLPVQMNDDGCLISCLKGFCDLIQKVCQVALAVFNYIFCCGCCNDDEPPERHSLFRNKNVLREPVDPQRIPPIFKPNDLPPLNPDRRPVVQPQPVVEPNRAQLVQEYYESMLDDDDLKALLAASGNAHEMGIIQEALRKRKAAGYVVENPPEPHRILPGEQLDGLDPLLFNPKPAPGIQTIPVVPTVKSLPGAAIPIRPLAPPAATEDKIAQPCPVAPLRIAGKAGDGTPVKAVIQFIKDEIANDANWGFNLTTFNEINVPVVYQNYLGPRRIQENCDRLTQEDWIKILNEIQHEELPAPVIQLDNSYGNFELKEGDIKSGFLPDREVVMKQRLAVLAKVWVDAKTPDYMGRARDQSPQHPFHAIYDNIGVKDDDGYSKIRDINDPDQAEQTLLAMQELIRYLPLIKAFAAEKKQIRVQYPGLEERMLNVNYLLDSVLSISIKLTGLVIHNASGPSQFKKLGSNRYESVFFKELDSDKIATAADTMWNAYLKAEANQDLSTFLKSFDGYCFDARISSLNGYIRKFAVNPDFMLNPEKLKGDHATIVAEYYEVFLHEQMAIYCERQEPRLKYDQFKKKIEEERASEAAKQDPVNIDFFKNYATQDRFKAWSIQIDKDNRNIFGQSMLPRITQEDFWSHRDVLWEETLKALENVLGLDFEP